jgi:hypothetical protein
VEILLTVPPVLSLLAPLLRGIHLVHADSGNKPAEETAKHLAPIRAGHKIPRPLVKSLFVHR